MKRSRVLEVEIDLTKQNIELQNDESNHSHRSIHSQQNNNKQDEIDEEDYGEEDDAAFELNMKHNQQPKEDEYDQDYDMDEPPLAKSLSAIALGTHQRQYSPKSGMRRVQSVGSDVLIPRKNSRHSSPPNRNSMSRRARNPNNENNNNKVGLSASLRGLAQSFQNSKDVQTEISHLQKQLNSIESSRYMIYISSSFQIEFFVVEGVMSSWS